MLTGATSLDLVRDELFASVAGVENLLQQFLEERHNGSLLQQAIEGLQQLRGTLNLIELSGAALLLEEMIALATDIPVHDGEGRNAPLTALCNSLFQLQRYLHLCRQQGAERQASAGHAGKHRQDCHAVVGAPHAACLVAESWPT